MRIHIQNPSTRPPDPITWDQWRDAAARAGEDGHDLTIADTDADYAGALATAEAVITTPPLMRALPPAPKLRLLFSTSAGVDGLAPFDMVPPHAVLANNAGAHSAKAGEFGIMAVLMLANHLPYFHTQQRVQAWDRRQAAVLAGRRLTIVGLGGLGGAIAARARPFGLHITGVRTRPEPHPDCDQVIATADLDSVLPDTEFLLLACPLTPATRHILDARRIALLPPHAGVVNIGRGGLVEQDALCDALEAGRIAGAVLDVFTPEPVPPGHRLWTTRNLIMTPHMSCDDPNTYNTVTLDIFFANLRALREGLPLPNAVDTRQGY